MNIQCLGITRNGSRCKMTGNLVDGYCHLHRKKESPDQTTKKPLTGNTPHDEQPPAPEATSSATSSESSNFMVLIGLFCIFLLLAAVALKGKRGR